MNDQKYCPSCGKANPGDAAFCAKCGLPFRAEPVTDMQPAASPPPYYEPIPSRPPRRFKKRYVAYGVIGLFVLFILVSAASPSSNDGSATIQAQQSTTMPTVTPAASAATATKTPTAKATAKPTASNNVVKGMEFSAKPVASVPQAFGTGGWDTPDAGRIFVGFDCTVRYISDSPGYTNDRIGVTYWQLRDNVGNVYEAEHYSVGDTGVKLFDSVDAKPGDVMSGYVIFEVPANHGAWKSISYDDGSRDVTILL